MANYEEILKQMTLEEKASLCSGSDFWHTQPVERLNIPAVFMSDGPHGLRKEKESQGTNIMKLSYPAVCFPTAVTLASSWDTDLAVEIGQAIADEAKEQGQSTVLGPGVNIKRSPLCGRNFEYFSEDPYLAGQMGASWVHGVQSQNIGVSLKHFCANNQEHIRMSVDTVCDERTMREIYLPAFEHTVKAEQPTTIMPSYNKVNGTYMCENKKYLTDILRDEWGFKGITISDWGAVNDRVEGVKAGNDLEMPGNNGMNDYQIIQAVKEGRLDEADLDKIALRMIKFAFECKAKEVPNYKTDYEKHHLLARKAASQGSVLLKNDDEILPLKGDEKIAVIGALAKHSRYQGAGSSRINPTKLVSFVDALTAAGKNFTYADGYTLKNDGYKASLIKEAQKVAKDADKVVAFIGLTDEYESEGFDRT
ncbi:MAG: glycoside hydrolase family 3 N-terminal domain-containing protein, partial [Christensenellales bacterium]